MKKILLTLAAATAMCYCSYGQGYFTFQSTGHVLDDFTTPGSPVNAADLEVDFIWMAGTSQTFSGISGASGPGASVSWSAIEALSDSSAGTGGTWAIFQDTALAHSATAPGPAIGEYNGGVVDLSGMASGSGISVYAIAWNAAAGTSLQAAAAAGAALGYSGEVNVTLGASTAPAGQLGAPGAGFDVDQVTPSPEPTTLALAGLGGLSMLFLRRRKA